MERLMVEGTIRYACQFLRVNGQFLMISKLTIHLQGKIHY